MKPLHPFPARMAPEIALNSMKELPIGANVLDPMSGSGTVLRQASQMGHDAYGFDLDPLSVLMGSVATTPIDTDLFVRKIEKLVDAAGDVDPGSVCLPWIDDDPETQKFVDFWFASKQQNQIRQLVHVILTAGTFTRQKKYQRAAQLALSRIIVTKEQRASLARDTSHSRPHRVATENSFDVFNGLISSAKRMAKVLSDGDLVGEVKVRAGDARNMRQIANESIDAIVTSPPYLNAIDYLRGHKMSLVWFGHDVKTIRNIRTSSIGAERALSAAPPEEVEEIAKATGDLERHNSREKNMIIRFSRDMHLQLRESVRVLKQEGIATYVVGDSCLKGNFIQNSEAVVAAANGFGLKTVSKVEREIPPNNRYLPTPKDGDSSLGKRMRKEMVLTFKKVA